MTTDTPSDVLTFRVKSTDRVLRLQVMGRIKRMSDCRVDFNIGDLREPLKSADPVSLSIAALAVAVADFSYSIWQDMRKNSIRSADGFRSNLETKLLEQGVVDFRIVSIADFASFRKGEALCSVIGKDANDRKFKVWVFLDGDVATLELGEVAGGDP